MLWKLKSTHGPAQKHATPVSHSVWLGVGIEDPWGVVEIQVHSCGTLEKIPTYISSHKHMHVHTRPFCHVVCSLSLRAGMSPVKFIKDLKKTPSQHAAPCNGIGGYPLPTQTRIATEINTQAVEMAQIATPLRLKTPPTHGVMGQRHPLQFILVHLYVEDDASL